MLPRTKSVNRSKVLLLLSLFRLIIIISVPFSISIFFFSFVVCYFVCPYEGIKNKKNSFVNIPIIQKKSQHFQRFSPQKNCFRKTKEIQYCNSINMAMEFNALKSVQTANRRRFSIDAWLKPMAILKESCVKANQMKGRRSRKKGKIKNAWVFFFFFFFEIWAWKFCIK